tara:strand:+ start:16920 stop:17441 length:522 start_codon:yes stop_codon:yes gene_type:complete
MNNLIIKHSIRFILFVFLQIFIFNNILFLGYINPYVYLLFIILLPYNKSNKNLTLIIALATGLIIDTFQNSMGMHAFTCVLIAYIRSSILYRLVPQLKNKSQNMIEISVKEFGAQICIIYTILLVFIHHLALFTIEAFRFDISNILLRTIASTLITSIFLIIFQFLNSSSKLK